MIFTSPREKRLWVYIILVLVAIYSSLGFLRPIFSFLQQRSLLDTAFVIGFIFIILAIFTQGIKKRPAKREMGLMLGIIAIYLLMFVRIEIPAERTHLIEYGIVGLLFLEVLSERNKQTPLSFPPAFPALMLSSLTGLMDEIIQAALPNRVFDLRDIFFNFLAALMAILAVTFLKHFRKSAAD